MFISTFNYKNLSGDHDESQINVVMKMVGNILTILLISD